MSWKDTRGDAIRAGIAAGFLVLGAWLVTTALLEAEAVPLALAGPVLAVLVGVLAYRSAREEGDR